MLELRNELAERVLGHGARDLIERTDNTWNHLTEARQALQLWAGEARW